MKVLFIYNAYENLGIQYLSAVLKKAGHQTDLLFDYRLFDDNYLSIPSIANLCRSKNLLNTILAKKADIIAFSVVTDDYLWACDMAKAIKTKINTPIVFGGPHPTSVPEKVLKKEYIDYVVIGEAEDALLELVDNIKDKKQTNRIKNVWSKENKTIIKNDIRPLSSDIDRLPFPDKDLFLNHIPFLKKEYRIITSRGCPYNCSYCINSFLKNLYRPKDTYFRKRSKTNVIQELNYAKEKWHPKRIQFYDETFAYNTDWLSEFSEDYIKNIHLPFWCSLHPEDISPQIASLLKRMNCIEVQMGVQILDKKIRMDTLNRPGTNTQIKNAINLLNKSGIKCVVDNIIGLPGSTHTDIENLVSFYNETRPSRISIYYLRYYPKTPIIHLAKQTGLLTDADEAQIDEGLASKSFALGGSISMPDTVKKLDLYLAIMLLFPRRINIFIMNHDLYKFLPKNRLLISLIKICSRIVSTLWKKNDINAQRYIRRYTHYFYKKHTKQCAH